MSVLNLMANRPIAIMTFDSKQKKLVVLEEKGFIDSMKRGCSLRDVTHRLLKSRCHAKECGGSVRHHLGRPASTSSWPKKRAKRWSMGGTEVGRMKPPVTAATLLTTATLSRAHERR